MTLTGNISEYHNIRKATGLSEVPFEIHRKHDERIEQRVKDHRSLEPCSGPVRAEIHQSEVFPP